MIKEEYKDIPDTEFVPLKEGIDPVFWDKYEINKLGEIKNINSSVIFSRSCNRVALRIEKYKKNYSIHILLANTFLIKSKDSEVVTILDKDKPIELNNIQWTSRSNISKDKPHKAWKWKNFNTLEDFQKYINENNIRSPKDFQLKDRRLYYRAGHNLKLDLFKLVYPSRKNTNWGFINTLEDVKKFIIEKNITKDIFVKNYDGLLQRLRKREIYLEDIFPEEIAGHEYSYYDSLEKFQSFIDDNNIQSPSEFHETCNKLYRKSLQYEGLVYANPGKSRGEKILEEILTELGIDFIHDKTADFLSQKKSRLDFRIDEYDLVIEYQGTQHFLDSEWKSFEEQYKLDKIKYEECTSAGYTVIYVIFPFLDKERYSKINFNNINYLGKIFNDKKSLINFLKQLKNETGA